MGDSSRQPAVPGTAAAAGRCAHLPAHTGCMVAAACAPDRFSCCQGGAEGMLHKDAPSYEVVGTLSQQCAWAVSTASAGACMDGHNGWSTGSCMVCPTTVGGGVNVAAMIG